MKIIDAHTHVFPQYADLAVRVMDRVGISYPSFKRNQAGYSIRGLRLPNEVCEKLLYKNVERILLTQQI